GPTVAINGNAGRNDGNSFNQNQGRVVNGILDFASASIDANMPLFRGLNVLNTYRQNSSLYEAQFNQVSRTNQDVMRDIARQYLTCLLDERLVVINQKNVETQKQQFDQIAEQVNAGSRAEVDMRNQEYQVKNAELLLLRAQNTLRNDKAILAATLLMDPAQGFEIEEPTWPVTVDNLTLEELYATAAERRSDLTGARHIEKAAHLGYAATKGTYFPSITAFASYGSAYNYIHGLGDPGNRTFEQQFTEDNTQLTYGVTFRIPVYSAFQNRSNVVRNRMLYENAKLQTENTEIVVKTQVQLAYQNLKDAQSAFDAAQAQLQAAEVSNSLERERYQLGISDIVALTLSNQTLTRAQSDFESAKYTLMFQKLLVSYAIGTLKFEDIP
ncbi:MAG: TolC family protein, partial [Bacteroidota bacterium]